MSYFSVDNNGNRYEIFSKYGILNEGSDLILMEKVNAIVYLSNDEKVLIIPTKQTITMIIMIQLLAVQ